MMLVASASLSDQGASLTQQEYIFERRLWPEDTSVSSCRFHFCVPRAPWPHDIWLATTGKLAIGRWLDQGGSGWEPIIISDLGDTHLPRAGFRLDSEVAIQMSPGMSPSGRYAASGYETKYTSTSDGLETPVLHGRYVVGSVTVIDLHSAAFWQITITDAVPAKLHGTASRWTDTPVFTSEEEFTLMLPTGSKRIFRGQEH